MSSGSEMSSASEDIDDLFKEIQQKIIKKKQRIQKLKNMTPSNPDLKSKYSKIVYFLVN
jgi:hypothetical protein